MKGILTILLFFIGIALNAQILPAHYGLSRITVISVTGKLPITSGMIWQNNFAANQSKDALVDGSLSVQFAPGQNFPRDTHDVYIEVPRQWNTKVTKVRWYDTNGTNADNPSYVIGKKRYGGQEVILATFTGPKFLSWDSVAVTDTSTFDLIYFRNYHINGGGNLWPAELEIYGRYVPYTKPIVQPTIANVDFENMRGTNGYWFWVVNPADLTQARSDHLSRITKMKQWRSYLDWQRLQYPGDSTHFYYYDSVFKWLKDSGMYVTVSPQTIPQYLFEDYYPSSMWPGFEDEPNNIRALTVLIPARWQTDWENPEAFRKKAQFGWQIAARYGRNPDINQSLVKSHTPDVFYIPKDANVFGQGTVDAIEGGNEDDKDWMGTARQFHMNGREMAAYMSAFYDGNKNTMGAGVGVKNADSTMKVILVGLARSQNSDYLRGIRSWTIEHRGYRADGVTPDYPFDEINFHRYSNDYAGQQNGLATRGQAPELSGWANIIDTMLLFSANYADNMPITITESGYDTKDSLNPTTLINGTTQTAIAIGAKSMEKTQADWILRSELIAWAKGICRFMQYEVFDNENVNPFLVAYLSSGLFWHGEQSAYSGSAQVKNKQSGNYLIQAGKIIDDWAAAEIVSTSPAWIIRMTKGDSTGYVVWVGNEIGATASVTLPISSGVSYGLNYNSEDYSESSFVTGGSYTFTATETPVFIKVLVDGGSFITMGQKVDIAQTKKVLK